MSQYVVTYAAEAGQQALSVAVNLGNDEQGRQFASRTAQRCHAVSLFAVGDEGLSAPVAEWLNGVLQRQNGNRPVVIEGEVDTEIENEDFEDEDDIAPADDLALDDEAHSFEGQCMKCKTRRAFIGRVKELSNGSKAAMGNCPICGTTITRMVARTTPVDDWSDSDVPAASESAIGPHGPETHALVTEPGGRRGTHYTCTCGEFGIYARNPAIAMANFEGHKAETDEPSAEDVESGKLEGSPSVTATIAEAISDTTDGTIAEIAEATAVAAIEFSNAAAEVEAKPAPAKRQPAKRGGKTANQIAAATPVKAKCPQCGESVDTIERAGIQIFTLHPDKQRGLERCSGSTTVVAGV